MMESVDILDELSDPALLRTIREGREAIKSGNGSRFSLQSASCRRNGFS